MCRIPPLPPGERVGVRGARGAESRKNGGVARLFDLHPAMDPPHPALSPGGRGYTGRERGCWPDSSSSPA
ncbi:hypothetical protein EI613_01320 [Azospirillum sp. 412522]|nr:hypothetical protein [Azospirillum sp. 412522]